MLISHAFAMRQLSRDSMPESMPIVAGDLRVALAAVSNDDHHGEIDQRADSGLLPSPDLGGCERRVDDLLQIRIITSR